MLRVLEPKENKIPRVWMGSKINTRQGTQNKKKKQRAEVTPRQRVKALYTWSVEYI